MNDLISKSALVDALAEKAKNMAEVAANAAGQAVDYYSGMKTGFASAAIMANSAQTIEPKRGKWMNKQMHDETLEPMNAWKHKCSVCGFYVVSSEKKSGWQFCPNCGASMDELFSVRGGYDETR